jgi:uncharacterized protein YgiM (DUF1202 family)
MLLGIDAASAGWLDKLKREVKDSAMNEVRYKVPQAGMISAGNMVCGTGGDALCRNLTGVLVASFTEEFIERMTRKDLEKAAEARDQSIKTGEPQVWSNPDSGASGTVESKPAESLPPVPTPIEVEETVEVSAPIMNAVGETYVVKASEGAEVHRGPGAGFPTVMTMPAGERFNAIAKLQEDNWYLAGQGSVGKGYVDGDLIESAPVMLEEPAPVPAPKAVAETREVEVAMTAECYTTSQSVSLADGTTEEATVTSCRTPDGWVQV